MKRDEPSVSIVIPVYNRESLIYKTVASAISQDYNNLEIIIVDNHSTDGTWSIIQELEAKHSNISAYRNDVNIGPVKNWQKCIELAKGDYVKILFSDDIMTDDCVSKFMQQMRDDVGFVSCSPLIGKTRRGARQRYRFSRLKNVSYLNSDRYLRFTLLSFGGLVSPSAAIFRRNDLLENFTPQIKFCTDEAYEYYGAGPDLLLFLKIAKKYQKVVWINKPLVFFLDHEDSATIQAHKTKVFNIRKSYVLTRIWFAENYGLMHIAKILRVRNRKLLDSKLNLTTTKNLFIYLRSIILNIYFLPISLWLNK